MKKKTTLCTTSAVERPKRKLILLRAKKATDYFSFCEECGCDWYGLLDSISSKLDAPGLITLASVFDERRLYLHRLRSRGSF